MMTDLRMSIRYGDTFKWSLVHMAKAPFDKETLSIGCLFTH